MSVRKVAAEVFEVRADEQPIDLTFAVRVGTLVGRQPKAGRIARQRIADALTPQGRLFIDGGGPLRDLRPRRR
jgi:hypothetical protein